MKRKIIYQTTKYMMMGMKCIPLFGIWNGFCTCFRACETQGKHPNLSAAQTSNLSDYRPTMNELYRHLITNPYANIGMRCENGLIVIDCDNIESYETVFDLLTTDDWIVRTGRGYHIYFHDKDRILGETSKSIRSGDVKIDVKTSGYVLIPECNHISGCRYEQIQGQQVQPIRDDIVQFINNNMLKSQNVNNKSARIVVDNDEFIDWAYYRGVVKTGERHNILLKVMAHRLNEGIWDVEINNSYLSRVNGEFKPPLKEWEVRTIVNGMTKKHTKKIK